MTNHVTRHLVRGMFFVRFCFWSRGLRNREVSIEPLELQKGVSRFWPVLSVGYLFPSDHFLVDDPTMPSGKRIAMQASAILPTIKASSPTSSSGVRPMAFQWFHQLLRGSERT